MEKLTNFIYHKLLSFNPLLAYIDADDIKQEIRFSILSSKSADLKSVLRESSKNVYRLLCDYGFSRKKGKDNFSMFYKKTSLSDEQKTQIDAIERIYIEENLTARDLCGVFGVDYNKRIQKLLYSVFPKGLPHGGFRKGSGQKKRSN